MKLLVAALLGAFSVSGPSTAQGVEPTVRPRTTFVVRSRLEYAADPRVAQILEAHYAAPDRARWNRRLLNGSSHARDCWFRDGETAHHLPQGEYRSRPFQGEDLTRVLRSFELRKAALAWPDAFRWSPAEERDGVVRRTTQVQRSSAADAAALGTLVATLDEEGRPTSITSFDASDVAQETLHILSWQTEKGYAWPRQLSLEANGRKIWDERVETIALGSVRLVPSFFLPPDLRSQAADGDVDPNLLPLDLLGLTLRKVAVPDRLRGDGAAWEDVLAWADDIVATETKRLAAQEPPLAVSNKIRIEVDLEARPTHLLVSLEVPELPAPAGWETLHDRPGIALIVGGLPQIRPAVVRRLRSESAEPEHLDPVYLWFLRQPGGTRVTAYQALVASR